MIHEAYFPGFSRATVTDLIVTVVCEDRGHQTHTTEHGESV